MDMIVKFFQDGGAFMYPIAVVAALGIAVAIERYFYLTRTASGPSPAARSARS